MACVVFAALISAVDGVQLPDALTDRRLSFAANANGCITNLHISGDTSGMNWVHVADGSQYRWIGADKAWGSGTLRVDGNPVAWSTPIRRETAADGTEYLVYPATNHQPPTTNPQLEVRVSRRLEHAGTALYERYEFVNVSGQALDLSEIDVHTPFNDNYPPNTNEMFALRCHAHVWPGGAGAWVAAMRMGGAAPHLGLAVVEGSIDAYEHKERALNKGLSNVRGVIALSPADVRLPPGGKTVVAWRVFAQTGWDDFFARLRELGGVEVKADRYVVRPGETVKITARTAAGTWTRDWTCPAPGEHFVDIAFGADHSRTSRVEVLSVADPNALVLVRARFIVAHQQVNESGSPYDGAFVPYDNETNEIQCRWKPGTAAAQRSLDHAEGAERVGMGVFLALLAQRGHKDEFLPALRRYHRFVRNGLQDPDYAVWQTVARPVRPRAFNYPWVIWFHLEMYHLTGEARYLDDMYGTFCRLFSGRENVPDALVAFPIGACVEALRSAGRPADAKVVQDLACAHLKNIAAFNGTIKTMEVGMAPEMVSGCIGQLLDLHRVTGEVRYLDTARRFVPLAEAICGRQPSWHAHDIGLHHWDGYWFGKRACWGDTLPHDWNGEMGLSFLKLAAVTGETAFAVRAKGIADAMLGLFTPDGRGSCAWVYPNRVNGAPARFADPLANDQDWALAFYLLCQKPLGRSEPFFGVDAACSWLSRPGFFRTPTGETDLHRYTVDRIAEMGFPQVRERLSWNEVNPKKDIWDFSLYLKVYSLYQAKGIRVSGMFHDAPQWMETKGKLPTDLRSVYEFCKRLGETFGDRVEVWEFWNEEDIGFCEASAWDYTAAAKAAYLGFKDARPNNPALMGALCKATRSVYDDVLFANDLGLYTDAMNFHCYAPRAEQPSIYAALRQFLAERGLADLAIWVTESGTHEEGLCEKDGVMAGQRAHSPEQEHQQAAIAAESLLLMMMGGISRDYFFVFPPYNEIGGKKDWGMMRRDGTLKPIAGVFKEMIGRIGNAELLGEVAGEPGRRTYAFRKSDGSHLFCTVGGNVFPTYRDGVKDVKVTWPAQPRGRLGARPAAVDEDRRVVVQLKVDDKAFPLGGGKSSLEFTGASDEMTLVLYNLDGAAKTGTVKAEGGCVDGLPEKIELPAWGRTTMTVRFRPQVDRTKEQLVFTGTFNGRRISRLVVPVTNPAAMRRNCVERSLALADDARWLRNDSATDYETSFDAATGVRRFHLVWKDNVDRWTYPKYKLDAGELKGAVALEFEIRTEQDKVENDFVTQNVILFEKGGAARHLGYASPLGTWEKRRIDLSAEKGLEALESLSIGLNPAGRDLTFFLRNVRVYSAK